MKPIEEENCNNCKHKNRLIMWERDKEGNYLPNYDKKLACCTAFVNIEDGKPRVYGFTEDRDDICEMWAERKE